MKEGKKGKNSPILQGKSEKTSCGEVVFEPGLGFYARAMKKRLYMVQAWNFETRIIKQSHISHIRQCLAEGWTRNWSGEEHGQEDHRGNTHGYCSLRAGSRFHPYLNSNERGNQAQNGRRHL